MHKREYKNIINKMMHKKASSVWNGEVVTKGQNQIVQSQVNNVPS